MAEPALIASAWTSAGDTSPMHVPATRPVPIAERLAAVAEAGYRGLGLIAADLALIRDSIGYPALRDLLAEHELTHLEIELIERWWLPRDAPGNTYDVRDLLFEAADALSPSYVKIGSENGPAIDDPLALVEPLRQLHALRLQAEAFARHARGAAPEGTTAEEAARVLELAHRLTEAAGIAVLGASR